MRRVVTRPRGASCSQRNSAKLSLATIIDPRSGRLRHENGTLVPQEPLLAFEAAAITREASIRADHPVAGHDDADRVLAVRKPYSTDGGWPADPSCQLCVADGGAAFDPAQGAPYALLEGRAGRFDGKIGDGAVVTLEVAAHGRGEAARIASGCQGIAALAILAVE